MGMWSTDVSRWGITWSIQSSIQGCGTVIHVHSVLQHTLGELMDGSVCRHAGGPYKYIGRHNLGLRFPACRRRTASEAFWA